MKMTSLKRQAGQSAKFRGQQVIENTYEVIVGNIGRVCETHSLNAANSVYQIYKQQSIEGYGRASGEPVYLTKNGAPFKEWIPFDDEADS